VTHYYVDFEGISGSSCLPPVGCRLCGKPFAERVPQDTLDYLRHLLTHQELAPAVRLEIRKMALMLEDAINGSAEQRREIFLQLIAEGLRNPGVLKVLRENGFVHPMRHG
jgi:hypothetical protein